MSSYIELNKEKFSSIFTNVKNDIMGFDQNLDMKIIIDENANNKSILVLKGINLEKSKINEIQRYSIKDNRISKGEFSNDLYFFKGRLIANNLIKYFNDEIIKLDNSNTIIDNFDKYNNHKFVHKNFENKNEFKLIYVIKFIYFMVFFWCLFTIFLSRENLDKKKNFFIPFLVGLVLLVYSLIIGTNNITQYNHLFSIITLLIFSLVFIKYYRYE
tara:strand:- start:179 stop:823 length:645 start_codon:yes stop_codon:yes gene_type:complete